MPLRLHTLGRQFLLGVAAFLFIAATVEVQAGNADRFFGSAPAILWERWLAHDPESEVEIDHSAWDRFLKTYLVEEGGIVAFDYGAVDSTGRSALGDYLRMLSDVPVSTLSRKVQRAYWINLYNALTVEIVLKAYPTASIRDIDISSGLFSDGPWDRKLVEIEGEPLSLNDVAHRILRPIWKDRRLIYVLSAACLGCPEPPSEALDIENSERILDAAARRFINDPRNLRFVNGGVLISSYFVWHIEDFGDFEPALLDHLMDFAEPKLKARLARVTSILGHSFDWRLNDTNVER